MERPLRFRYTITEETQQTTLNQINRYLNARKRAILFDSVAANMMQSLSDMASLGLDNMDQLERDTLIMLSKGYAILDDFKYMSFFSLQELEEAFESSPKNDGKKKLKLSAFSKIIGYPGYQSEPDPNADICKDKKGQPIADANLRDTENVPMTEDVEDYLRREVLPYEPDAWIDHKKTKIGYEIPMTRYFYEYQAPEKTEDIMARITTLEQDISASLKALFHKEG